MAFVERNLRKPTSFIRKKGKTECSIRDTSDTSAPRRFVLLVPGIEFEVVANVCKIRRHTNAHRDQMFYLMFRNFNFVRYYYYGNRKTTVSAAYPTDVLYCQARDLCNETDSAQLYSESWQNRPVYV